jgi:exopolysaccharide biosynthesis protein
MNIVEFPKSGISDIPERLRNLADLIESGAKEGTVIGIENAKTLVWITVDEYGEFEIGALGYCPSLFHAHGIAALAAGKQK